MLRLCRALDAAGTVVELFAEKGYADGEVPQSSFEREKPVAETAMLLYAALAARRFEEVSYRVGEVARRLIPHARSNQTMVRMCLQPSRAATLALPHVLLTRLGFPDPEFEGFARTCLAASAGVGCERPVVGNVERLWVESMLTGTPPGSDWRAILRSSLLGGSVDLIGGSREDHYAFTHLLMYSADFGFRAPDLPRSVGATLAEAESQLAKCLNSQDYDLVGELLMSWPLVGEPWSPAAVFCFRLIANIETRLGVLPGGTTRAERLAKLSGEEKRVYAFATGYHTVYVLGILCALSLRPGRLPPEEIDGSRVDQPTLEGLFPHLADGRAAWEGDFDALPDREKVALGPFLLDLAIDQACRRRDFGRLRDLLEEAVRRAWVPSPFCVQAAELLERLAGCAQAMEARRNGGVRAGTP